MPTDNRFIFEERALAEWLLQLADEDGVKRKAAAKVVIERFFMPTELILESGKDAGELQVEFLAAVRAAVGQPGFPAVGFVRNVLALAITLQELWCEEVAANSNREKEADDAALKKL